MKKTIEVVPNARRTFAALRDIGYSFNTAVADIVDNSIAADATTIMVELWRRDEHAWLSIIDNGTGMDAPELLEAVRIGSEEEYSANSLGKYGVGLKTASLSQTRCLVVGSRPRGKRRISAYELNLDHIDRENRWELFALTASEISSNARLRALEGGAGTAVIWSGLDRISEELAGYKFAGAADNYFGRLLNDLELHLRMTFERFLAGGAKRGGVSILFNGKTLAPWDPFCRREPKHIALRRHEYPLPESQSGATVLIQPYVLPMKEGEGGFSSLAAWAAARGLLPWNDSQGYYVYRNDRLIHAGGWLRTRAKDEHTKYARVAVDFTSDADSLFSLSVNKSQIRLPASLFEYLKDHVNPEVTRAAQQPYRDSGA